MWHVGPHMFTQTYNTPMQTPRCLQFPQTTAEPGTQNHTCAPKSSGAHATRYAEPHMCKHTHMIPKGACTNPSEHLGTRAHAGTHAHMHTHAQTWGLKHMCAHVHAHTHTQVHPTSQGAEGQNHTATCSSQLWSCVPTYTHALGPWHICTCMPLMHIPHSSPTATCATATHWGLGTNTGRDAHSH